MFCLRNKKNNIPLRTLIWGPVFGPASLTRILVTRRGYFSLSINLFSLIPSSNLCITQIITKTYQVIRCIQNILVCTISMFDLFILPKGLKCVQTFYLHTTLQFFITPLWKREVYRIWVVSFRSSVRSFVLHKFFVSAKYLQKSFIEFIQILYAHWYRHDLAWNCNTLFFPNSYQSYGPFYAEISFPLNILRTTRHIFTIAFIYALI